MKLILENWREYLKENYDLAKSIDYTALILNDLGNRALLLYVPEGWEPLAHHMTIINPPEMTTRLPSRWIGGGMCVKVTAIAQNDRVASALVDLEGIPLPMKGPAYPHITIALNPLGEPKVRAVESNDIPLEEYEPIEPITVCGTIKEIQK